MFLSYEETHKVNRFLISSIMMIPKVKTSFPSFSDIIAGSAGGGAILLIGLVVLILLFINRSVFYIVRTQLKK